MLSDIGLGEHWRMSLSSLLSSYPVNIQHSQALAVEASHLWTSLVLLACLWPSVLRWRVMKKMPSDIGLGERGQTFLCSLLVLYLKNIQHLQTLAVEASHLWTFLVLLAGL